MKEKVNHIQDYFKDLSFKEDTHQYFVKDKPLKYSVSGLIKKFVEPFDAEGISTSMSYTSDKTPEQIRAEWKAIADEACTEGTRIHLFGENYVWDRSLRPSHPKEQAIVNFWNDLPDFIIPVMMEVQMYHKIYLFAGTADILLYNTKTGEYILGDYKTNKDLFKNYKGKTLLNEFSELLDMPFSKYEIQLSFYQILFEQLGFKVSKRRIIWLLPNGNYEMFDCRDFTNTLKKWLKDKYES